MANVTIKYREQIIAELNNLGSVTLLTKDHGCDSNIEIDYINYCPRTESEYNYILDEYYINYYQYIESAVEFGELQNSLTAYSLNFALGYVDGGTYKYYPSDTNQRMDIYQVDANKSYLIRLGSSIGNRFRVMFTTTDVTQVTENITGTSIYNTNSPSNFINTLYNTTSSGYILVYKSSSAQEIDTYVSEVIYN
jgi:hypothetical protein